MGKYIDADHLRKEVVRWKQEAHKSALGCADSEMRKFFEVKEFAYGFVVTLIDSLQQEQPEISLEKFIERMDAWKARYNYPDNIPVKGAMAFTARMFYMYPKAAMKWYESLPKATQD